LSRSQILISSKGVTSSSTRVYLPVVDPLTVGHWIFCRDCYNFIHTVQLYIQFG